MILKLSNLLDYILYQVKKPRVSLKEELEHICEYIELEKIRFRDSLKVELNFPEIADGIEIAPMLLIPFVENAFKHGRKKNNVLEIAIQADMENDRLEFNISNSITGKGEMNPGHGIGLDNLRKRLELHYTGDHSLEITRNAGMFKVQLVIYHLNTIQNG